MYSSSSKIMGRKMCTLFSIRRSQSAFSYSTIAKDNEGSKKQQNKAKMRNVRGCVEMRGDMNKTMTKNSCNLKVTDEINKECIVGLA